MWNGLCLKPLRRKEACPAAAPLIADRGTLALLRSPTASEPVNPR